MKDTIKNYMYYAGNLKCGICYGVSDNDDIASFTKVYADKIYHTQKNNKVFKGMYDVSIRGLEESGKYQLCGFIEYDDGTTSYGKIYNAVTITPKGNSVYMGERPVLGKVCFWSTGELGKDGNFIDPQQPKKYSDYFSILCTTNASYEEAQEFLSNLEEKGWDMPKQSNFDVFDWLEFNYDSYKTELIQNKETGKLELIKFTSWVNGNSLYFRFQDSIDKFLEWGGGGYLTTYTYWISDINKNGKHKNAYFVNDNKGMYMPGKIRSSSEDYWIDGLLRPIYEITVTW